MAENPSIGITWDLGSLPEAEAFLDRLEDKTVRLAQSSAAAAAAIEDSNKRVARSYQDVDQASKAPATPTTSGAATRVAAAKTEASAKQSIQEAAYAAVASAAVDSSSIEAKAAADVTAAMKAEFDDSVRAMLVSSQIRTRTAKVEAAERAAAEREVTAAAAAAAAARLALEREEIAAEQALLRSHAAAIAEDAAAEIAADQARQAEMTRRIALLRQQGVEEATAARAAAAAQASSAAEAAAAQEAASASMVASAQRAIAIQAQQDAEVEASRRAAIISAGANAEAEIREAEARLQAARAGVVTEASLLSEKAALDALTASLIRNSEARAAAVALKAENVGADTGQAVATSLAATALQGARQTAIYDRRASGLADAIEDAKKTTTALGDIEVKASVVREGFVLLREAGRRDFTRLSGSASLFLQNLGGVDLLLKAIPFVAAAGAVAALVFEMEKGSEDAAKLANALALTNNYAGLTEGSFQELASAIAGNTNTAIGKVQETLLTLVSGGRLSGDALAYVADASARLAVMTGQDANKVAQQLSQLFEDPVKGSMRLTEQYHYLTAAQFEHIKRLQEEGDAQGAVIAATGAFDDAMKRQSASVGILEGAYRSLISVISAGLNEIRNFGRLASDQQELAAKKKALDDLNKAAGSRPDSAIVRDTTSGNIESLGAARAGLESQIRALTAKVNGAPGSDVQTLGIKAYEDLEGQLRSVGGSAELAGRKIEDFHTKLEQLRAANAAKPSPELTARISELDRRTPQIEAQLRKQYDRQDYQDGRKSDAAAKRLEGYTYQANKQVDDITAAIKAYQTQLDQAAQFDLSPLADGAAKINKAYDDALSKFGNTRNTVERAQAIAFATSAAEKERLALVVQLANGLLSQARAEDLKTQSTMLSMQATQDAAAAINDYYLGATTLTEGLRNQAQVQVDYANRTAALTIAQKFGVTSISDISRALQTQLGLSKERADQVQQEAQSTLDLVSANNALAAAQKAQAAGADQHTAALATIKDLQDEAEAYRQGTAAVAAYQLKKTQDAAVTKVARPLTSTEYSDLILGGGADPRDAEEAQARGDVTKSGIADATAEQEKLNAAVRETQRLAELTTEERARDAEVQARIVSLVKAGVSPAQATLQAYSEIGPALRQAETETAKLKDSLNDATRDAFIKTGKIDFKGIEDGVSQALRKAIYDNFLAEPIKVILNATVDTVLGSFGSITGDGTKKIVDTLKKGFDSLPDGVKQGFTGAVAGLAEGTTIGSILGINQNTGAQLGAALGGAAGNVIGNAIAGPIGGAIGSLIGSVGGDFLGSVLGGGQSNNAAVVTLDNAGNVTSLGGGKRTDETTKAVTDVAGELKRAQQAIKDAGGTLSTTVQSIDLGVRDTTHIIFANGQRIETAVGDTAAAVKGAEQVLLQGTTFANARLQGVVDKMVAAGSSMDDVISKVKEFSDAQDFVSGIQQSALQYTDPLAYQLAQLSTSQKKRQDQFNSYVTDEAIDPAQKAALQTQITNLNTLEIQDALKNYSTSVDAAAHSTADFVSAQKKILDYAAGLTTSSLSPLSQQDQLSAAEAAYQSTLTKARGGDYDALSSVTDQAQTLLGIAQKFYASSGQYASIFGQVQNDLAGLGDQTFDTDSTDAAIKQASSDLQKAIGDGASDIVTALQALAGVSPNGTTTVTAAPAGANDNNGLSNDQVSAIVAAIGDSSSAINDQLAAHADATVAATTDTADLIGTGIGRALSLKSLRYGGDLGSLSLFGAQLS